MPHTSQNIFQKEMGRVGSGMKLGDWGEEYTANYLIQQGFVIVERNWHCRYGEIDIIAENDMLLLFVEVKTRTNTRFAQPYEAVDYRKQKKIRSTVETYLLANPTNRQPRVDVASIVAPQGVMTQNPEITYLVQVL